MPGTLECWKKCLWNAISGMGLPLGCIFLGRWWLEAFEVLCMRRTKEEEVGSRFSYHTALHFPQPLTLAKHFTSLGSVFILFFSFFFCLYLYFYPSFSSPFLKHEWCHPTFISCGIYHTHQQYSINIGYMNPFSKSFLSQPPPLLLNLLTSRRLFLPHGFFSFFSFLPHSHIRHGSFEEPKALPCP